MKTSESEQAPSQTALDLPLEELANQSRTRMQQVIRKFNRSVPQGKKGEQARKVLAQMLKLADKLEGLSD